MIDPVFLPLLFFHFCFIILKSNFGRLVNNSSNVGSSIISLFFLNFSMATVKRSSFLNIPQEMKTSASSSAFSSVFLISSGIRSLRVLMSSWYFFRRES